MQSKKTMDALLKKGTQMKTRKLGKKKILPKDLQNDIWKVSTLSAEIQKSVTDYLNQNSLDSEVQTIAYSNEPISVFNATPELVLVLRNSPHTYDPDHYLILHKRKDRRERWRLWRK